MGFWRLSLSLLASAVSLTAGCYEIGEMSLSVGHRALHNECFFLSRFISILTYLITFLIEDIGDIIDIADIFGVKLSILTQL